MATNTDTKLRPWRGRFGSLAFRVLILLLSFTAGCATTGEFSQSRAPEPLVLPAGFEIEALAHESVGEVIPPVASSHHPDEEAARQ